MLPKWHVLIGFVVSYILVYFFNFPLLVGLIIFLSSVLIDGDHYLWYGFKTKDWNPLHAVSWFYDLIEKHKKLSHSEKRMFKKHLLIFHGIEFWIILLILGVYINPLFIYILIGVGIHMIADWSKLLCDELPAYTKISQIAVWEKNKSKKAFNV